MKLPHFHIMNSEYGDCLERGIKTWEEACRQLRREAKIKFREAHPLHTERGTYYWNLSQIIASPMKEEE